MQREQAVRQLAQDSLLSTMPEHLAVRFKQAITVRAVTASSVIARQGQPADKLIIPVDSSLRLVTRTDRDAITTQLRARRALNLRRVLEAGVWDYSAFADTDVNIVEIDAAAFRAILGEAPGYATYLHRMTTRLCMRMASHVLRRNGLDPVAAQRVLMLVEEWSVAPGQTIRFEDETPWVLVDRGSLAMCHDERGAAIEIGTLTTGEFYGGGAILGRAASVQLIAREPAVILSIMPRALRALCSDADNIARALALEHPGVQLRIRRAFVESGQRFSEVMAIPVEAIAEHDEDEVAVAEAVAQRAPVEIGRPWIPAGSLARRLDGFRCGLTDDSGAAALASLLKFLDRPATYSNVRRALHHRVPPSLLDLARVAERHSLMTHASTAARPLDLGPLRTPFLLAHGDEMVVVHEVRRRSVRVFSPISGLREVTMQELERSWSGAVLAFTDVRPFVRAFARDPVAEAPKPGTEHKPEPAKPRGRGPYLKLFGDSRGPLFAAVLLSLALLVLSVISPRLNGLVVDQVLAYGDVGLLTTIAGGLVLIQFSSFLLTGFRDLCVTYMTALVEYRLSSLTLRHTLGIALDAHGEDRVGSAVARLDELRRVRTTLSTDIIQMLLQSAQGLVYLILVFTYSWKLGVIVLGALPLAYLLLRLIGRRTRARYLEMFDEHARLQSQTTEQVEQIATIKALGGITASQRRWETTLVSKLGIEQQTNRLAVILTAGMELVEEGVKVAALYVAVRLLLDGELSPGALLAVSQYASGALTPLLGLSGKLDELAQVGASFRRLEDLFAHPIEDDESAAIAPASAFEGSIVARNLEFAYPDGPQVLRNINFEIHPGQTVAIVGRSGSGKSTLAKLLHGALRPTGGELLFDDQDSRSLSLPAIRAQVGIVLQDSHLFAGTIRENIAYGDDRPDEKRVQEAARLAAAHEFITRFPAGYNTFLAEGGLGLSGGQRQRISIARALYRAPQILVMDEATSALDAESERAILENMREILRGRTGLVIAHRLNTVKNADRILVIDQGEIVEAGTHDDLVEKRGLYHSLFDRQFHQN